MKYQGEDLAALPNQILYSLEHFKTVSLEGINNDARHIVVCGLGGSGIAGRLIKSFFQNQSHHIIHVVSDYTLPKSVTKESLVICSSYSGNTEETLSAFEQAMNIGCQIIAITSGGTLQENASKANLPTFISPGGFQPRMALGYSLTYIFLIMGKLTGKDFNNDLMEAANQLSDRSGYIDDAKALLAHLNQIDYKFLQIVADGQATALSTRFQQQLNENAKAWAQVHEMPEMCHNVIEAMLESNINSPWLLIDSGKNDRISLRFAFLEQLLESKGYHFKKMVLDPTSIVDLLKTIYTFDWYSLLLADAKNINSAQIPNILSLKDLLSKE